MRGLGIDQIHFSKVFWKILFSELAFHTKRIKKELLDATIPLESYRKEADLDTGSITFATALSIAAVTAHFRPRIVAEIGTYIGRSTYSTLLGSSVSSEHPIEIHTCDFSNDINLRFPGSESVVQYPRTDSTTMLMRLAEKGIFPQAYVIDGRLSDEDILLLKKLGAKNAIFMFDDFRGIEKGVANVAKVIGAFPQDFLLAYPADEEPIFHLGTGDRAYLAVLVPTSFVKFVN